MTAFYNGPCCERCPHTDPGLPACFYCTGCQFPVDIYRTVPARVVAKIDAPDVGPGCLEPRSIPDAGVAGYGFTCPGCGAESWLPVAPEIGGWVITEGTFAIGVDVTLSPSIMNRCCGWHGYLTHGVFTPCPNHPTHGKCNA